jgi:hypothetical protein
MNMEERNMATQKLELNLFAEWNRHSRTFFDIGVMTGPTGSHRVEDYREPGGESRIKAHWIGFAENNGIDAETAEKAYDKAYTTSSATIDIPQESK